MMMTEGSPPLFGCGHGHGIWGKSPFLTVTIKTKNEDTLIILCSSIHSIANAHAYFPNCKKKAILFSFNGFRVVAWFVVSLTKINILLSNRCSCKGPFSFRSARFFYFSVVDHLQRSTHTKAFRSSNSLPHFFSHLSTTFLKHEQCCLHRAACTFSSVFH